MHISSNLFLHFLWVNATGRSFIMSSSILWALESQWLVQPSSWTKSWRRQKLREWWWRWPEWASGLTIWMKSLSEWKKKWTNCWFKDLLLILHLWIIGVSDKLLLLSKSRRSGDGGGPNGPVDQPHRWKVRANGKKNRQIVDSNICY